MTKRRLRGTLGGVVYRQNETALKAAMDRLERWFREHVEEDYFAPGDANTEGPLAAMQARWGGQRQEKIPFWDAYYLFGADHTAKEQAMMDGLARDEAWPASWWDPQWVPFASDFAGQLLVVEASTGRVIEFLHDDDPREVLAETLEAFLTTYADELESEARVLRDGYIVDRAEHEAALARQAEREREKQDDPAIPDARRVYLVAVGLSLLLFTLIMLYESCRAG